MLLVAAGLFFGSAILTLLILMATGSLSPARRSASVGEGAAPATTAPRSVGLSDLLLEPPDRPTGVSAGGKAPPYLLREPLERWSDQQIGRYWVPLAEIALDQVREENDRRIEKFFEEVP